MKFLAMKSSLTLAAIALAISTTAYAQNTTASASPGPTSTAKPAEAAAPKNDQIKPNKDKVVGGGQTANETSAAIPDRSSKTTKLVRVRQGEELSVEVGDLKKRVETQPNIITTAKLFLNCKPVAGLQPHPCLSENKIIFVLDREAIEQITPRTKIVSVGVAFNKATEPEVLMPEKVELVLVACDWRLAAAFGFVIVIAILLWRYGRYTNLLRDEPPSSSAPAPSISVWRLFTDFSQLSPRKDLGPYSLAKVQMAWWLFFAVSAFLFIWLAVGDFNSLTTSTLVLLGISVGTAAGSKMIDSSKQKTAQNLRATTTALRQPLAPMLNAEPAVQASLQATRAIQAQQAEAQAADLERPVGDMTSVGFLTDIMSDENGVSVHRFQMVVWTAVLTLVFLYEVFRTFAMPEFSSTLLTLMGISSGAYLTLKVPEKRSVPALPPAAPAP
jgi:hypothetical protein